MTQQYMGPFMTMCMLKMFVSMFTYAMTERSDVSKVPKELIPDITRLIAEGEPIPTEKIMKYLDPTKESARPPDGPFAVLGYEPPARGGDTRFYLSSKGITLGNPMNDSYDNAQRKLIEQRDLLESLGLEEEARRMDPIVTDAPFELPAETARPLLESKLVVEEKGKLIITELGECLYTFIVMTWEFDERPLSPETAVSFYEYMLNLYFVLGEGSRTHTYEDYTELAHLGYLGMIE